MSKRTSLTERRRARVAAAKERKKKIFAFAGVGVLVLLLVIQGPKMLELFGSGSTTIAAPPPPPTTVEKPEQAPPPRLGSRSVDPFSSRILANNDPQPGSVPTPQGARDPFLKVGSGEPAPGETPAKPPATPSPSPLPKRIVVGTPTPGRTSTRGWIVVIASIPTRTGRAYAERFAVRVRDDGLTAIGVLESSTNKPLRAGYFVVYNGPYATLSAVQRAADHVHAFGYRTAYIREIIRY
jgi:hypothetical protein